MKKTIIILVFACLSLTSCVKIPYVSVSYYIDYAKYMNDGFFITESNTIHKDYTPIASLDHFEENGYVILKPAEYDKRGYTVKYAKFGEYKMATFDNALNSFIMDAKSLGANGIINIKYQVFIDRNPSSTKYLTVKGYKISGMAIKLQ